MEVFKDIIPLKNYLKSHRFKGKSIGLVPTMGALHEGHISLVENAREDNDITVCSIYVNPTQFNNKNDLKAYPRNLEKDLSMLEEKGCDVVFVPSDDIMYAEKSAMTISFGSLEHVMEGKFRPGHFNGVGIVVSKLLNIVQPDKAYFGQKDLQQYLIIKRLVNELMFPVEIKQVNIVREADGLAKSSRNLRLSKEDRQKSVVLYRALLKVKEELEKGKNVDEARAQAATMFNVNGVQLEYLEIVDTTNLRTVENVSKEKDVAVCVAAMVGDIRLIDNIIFRVNA